MRPGRFASRRDAAEKSYLHNIPAARRLRTSQTDSEAALWEALRNGRRDGMKFRRQHPVGRFVVDFYCDDYRLAVEIDGAIHLDPEQRARDSERQRLLEEGDVAFVRVSDVDVLERLSEVVNLIQRTCAALGARGSRPARTTPPLPQRRERGSGGEG